MSRIQRITECPACGTDVIIQNARPNSTRRAFCDKCKAHPNHGPAYTQAARKYNLTYEELDKLYAINNCQCCGKELVSGGGPGIGAHNQRQIDHCHETEALTGEIKIRGVLCWQCNAGIGHLNDNLTGVLNALKYLTGEK